MRLTCKPLAEDERAKSGSHHARARRKSHRLPAQRISDTTRQRLLGDALVHPAFEGMHEADISAYLADRLKAFLSKQPIWFGTTKPRPQASQGLPEGLKRYQEAQRQERIDRERRFAERLQAATAA